MGFNADSVTVIGVRVPIVNFKNRCQFLLWEWLGKLKKVEWGALEDSMFENFIFSNKYPVFREIISDTFPHDYVYICIYKGDREIKYNWDKDEVACYTSFNELIEQRDKLKQEVLETNVIATEKDFDSNFGIFTLGRSSN